MTPSRSRSLVWHSLSLRGSIRLSEFRLVESAYRSVDITNSTTYGPMASLHFREACLPDPIWGGDPPFSDVRAVLDPTYDSSLLWCNLG